MRSDDDLYADTVTAAERMGHRDQRRRHRQVLAACALLFFVGLVSLCVIGLCVYAVVAP